MAALVTSAARLDPSRRPERCSACRRRKVRCDGVKPSCGLCTRLHLSCDWRKEWRFKTVSVAWGQIRQGAQSSILQAQSDSCVPGTTRYQAGDNGRSIQTQPLVSATNGHYARNTVDRGSDMSRAGTIKPASHGIPQVINPATVSRIQMLAIAMRHYLPIEELGYRCRELEQWPTLTFLNPNNSALFHAHAPLDAAVDAFTLAQASLSLKDTRLSVASVRRYSTCLAKLRIALEQVQRYSDNELLLCILMLQGVELMQPTSHIGGWLFHIHGAMRMLESQGPKLLTSYYETVLFHHVRQGAVLWGISHRKKIWLDHPDWLFMSTSAPMTSMETRLIDLGVKVPALLAVSDNLFKNGSRDQLGHRQHWIATSSASECISTWIQEFYLAKGVTLQVCNKDSFCGYLSAIAENPLQEAFLFLTYNDTWYLSMAWAYLFVIQNAQLTTLPFSNRTDEVRDELQASIDATVGNLCRVIPQFFDPAFGFLGRASINLFLRSINVYFEAKGDLRMTKFCQDVEGALSTSSSGHVIITGP
ncbi:hypothetical protein D6C78_10852 [Aureobasidium pullulans]|uniref:Zn(2)-C6 fungal-type domain-containing protein n=1 Tax=Aureobasidium pullulans TaxID=5580 RepID=A0A4T0B476_AURPU|nr:hypothetical protein D6C78_10852 [Aureobasidium pullulans]